MQHAIMVEEDAMMTGTVMVEVEAATSVQLEVDNVYQTTAAMMLQERRTPLLQDQMLLLGEMEMPLGVEDAADGGRRLERSGGAFHLY